jgi:WD40 repeat protein
MGQKYDEVIDSNDDVSSFMAFPVTEVSLQPSRPETSQINEAKKKKKRKKPHVSSGDDYVLKTLTGGALNRLPVVFSKDLKYSFIVAGSNVRMYALKTGELIRTLSNVHTSHLVACFLHPNNSLQLMTAEKNGGMAIWDYEDAVVIKVRGY